MLLELLFTNLLMLLGMHDFILFKRQQIGCSIIMLVTRASEACGLARARTCSATQLELRISFTGALDMSYVAKEL